MKTVFAILVFRLVLSGQEWPSYSGGAGGSHYSALKQIHKGNAGKLRIAWTYRTSDLEPASGNNRKAAFEATPILVNGTLYLSTAFNRVLALHPATGERKWVFDAEIDRGRNYSEVTSRGVSYWLDRRAARNAPCRERILLGTLDARLIALDALDGKRCDGFGKGGQVDLGEGIGGVRFPGDYQVTSPPAIAGDVIVVGSSIGDNGNVKMDRGTVRGFDARSGKVLWSWDPLPPELNAGAANAWSQISVDAERDLVFVPTGSASPDFYGGERKGDNRWANSVVALKASTGQFVWGFQVVHHDLWDYDVASQPLLFTWRGKTPAVAIATKTGMVFVLDRLTGKPLLPVEERPVPRSPVAGEESWPTQPFSSADLLAPQSLRAEDIHAATPEGKKHCQDLVRSLRWEGMYTPPSEQATLSFPGNAGGVAWGGPGHDPERGLLIVNTNRIPFSVRLIPREDFARQRTEAAKNRLQGEFAPQRGTPYGMYREPLRSPDGGICAPPPWGAISALDLNTGKKKWESPLGSLAEGVRTGSPGLGGPLVTGGGLVFIAATLDNRLRAFDSDSGAEVWSHELPASGQASPMTYSAGGKQYVVIAAGGHGKLGSKQGDYVVAFALE
ncbi:MAG: pyrroloquinoline quinone-dependent dehydrogenase [Bryobacteraceae bacterium]|nr:pyrroloquinoline quinone-dependent dehydrogenase [Bryobacteraceae bacterium]